jgi:CHAD domain-containing protein
LPGVLRQLVVTGDDGSAPERALKLPGSAFAVSSPTRSATLRRTWLDTFDWRLYRSGLTLEQISRRGSVDLVLTGRDGTVLAADHLEPGGTPRPAWPGLLDALPLGPLQDHLGPVVGVRALLPVARAVSTVAERRILNGDEKTIARVTVDRMSVSSPAAGPAPGPAAGPAAGPAPGPGAAAGPVPVPARLAVTALRGYEPQAMRVADLLAAAPGVTEGGQSGLEAALAATGRRPGAYTGKIDVRLTPRMPAAAALAAILTSLFDTLTANVPGTVRDLDTEFLHDLRIAVRRSRSALKLAGDVLPDGMAARFRPEFRWLGDLTTPTRDLDVYLLGYAGMASGLIAATPAELQPFHDYLERSRAAAQGALARGLRSARFRRLDAEWRHALADAGSGRRRPAVARLAGSRIRRAHRRVIRDGSAITSASPPESLHELRKRGKELRYLLEFFGSLYDPVEHWRAVRELKTLQDCLGEFQDTEVQHGEIRAFAEQMMAQRTAPAATLLAMGEIAAGLAAAQQRARSEFAGRFREFASPPSQNRIQDLTRAATS